MEATQISLVFLESQKQFPVGTSRKQRARGLFQKSESQKQISLACIKKWKTLKADSWWEAMVPRPGAESSCINENQNDRDFLEC